MRLKLIVLSIIVVGCLGLYCFDFYQQKQPSGQVASFTEKETSSSIHLPKAPQFSFKTIDDQVFKSIENLQEPLVFVNFWATWCAPCITELPDMLNMIKEFKGQAALVTISQDEYLQDVIAFQKSSLKLEDTPKHTYWVWDEDKLISKQFNTLKVPETIVLDRNRHMIQKIVGAQLWQKDDWTQFLD